MDTPPMLSPTSPNTPIKFTEHSRYCMICTPLGKYAQKIPLLLDCDDKKEEDDQVKGENKEKVMRRRPTQP